MSSTPLKADIVDAEIRAVRQHGLELLYGGGLLGWLPAEEWSYDPEAWAREHAALEKGRRLAVLRWCTSFRGADDVIFSLRRVVRNPWGHVSPEWLATTRVLTVTRLTRRDAIGEIEPGLQGRLDRVALMAHVQAGLAGDSDWPFHVDPQIGDRVVGVVTAIHAPDGLREPEIELDGVAFLRELDRRPEALLDLLGTGGRDTAAGERRDAAATAGPSRASHDVEHVLLVEDEERLARGMAASLEARGYDVKVLASESAVAEWLAGPEARRQFDLAVIDLHLTDNLDVHDGLDTARRLRQARPDCRLLLISGEAPVDADGRWHSQAEAAADLRVSGFLQKPFTTADLETAITHSAERERPLRELFAPAPAGRGHAGPAHNTGAERRRRALPRRPIPQLLQDLVARCPGSVAHVFEMNPLDLRGRSIAHAGAGLDWHNVRHKLGKSPVHDTAVKKTRHAWTDHDGAPGFAHRHLWLLEAMPYRAFIGVPVEVTSPHGYCLLLFHRERRQFDELEFAEAQLCAERIGRTLDWERLTAQSTSQARFEAAGMSLSFLSHELRNQLTAAAFDAEQLLKLLGAPPAPDTAAGLELAGNLHDAVRAAVEISRTFAGIQRQHAGREEPETVDPVVCLREALRAARAFVGPGHAIDVRTDHLPRESPHRCRTHGVGLTMALFNLALNAVQQMEAFVRKRGVLLATCTASGGDGERWLHVDVTDSGPGLHRGDFERIFDVGYSTRPEGTGLGLHIARDALARVVEGGRRGRLEIKWSALGVGTTFAVHLPLLAEARP